MHNNIAPLVPPMNFRLSDSLVVYGSDSVTATVQWLRVAGATNYTLYIRPAGTSELHRMAVSGTTASVDDLRYNTVYDLYLAGNNCAGSSSIVQIRDLLFGTVIDFVHYDRSSVLGRVFHAQRNSGSVLFLELTSHCGCTLCMN